MSDEMALSIESGAFDDLRRTFDASLNKVVAQMIRHGAADGKITVTTEIQLANKPYRDAVERSQRGEPMSYQTPVFSNKVVNQIVLKGQSENEFEDSNYALTEADSENGEITFVLKRQNGATEQVNLDEVEDEAHEEPDGGEAENVQGVLMLEDKGDAQPRMCGNCANFIPNAEADREDADYGYGRCANRPEDEDHFNAKDPADQCDGFQEKDLLPEDMGQGENADTVPKCGACVHFIPNGDADSYGDSDADGKYGECDVCPNEGDRFNAEDACPDCAGFLARPVDVIPTEAKDCNAGDRELFDEDEEGEDE